MLSRTVRIQLTIFTIVSVVVMVIVSANYLRVPRLFGWGDMTVKVVVENAAGLYPQAGVTYRGEDVGHVESLSVLDNGDVSVKMAIDGDIDIPADVDAEVHSRSAVGEQYVDLLPRSDGEPYLSDGDVIPKERSSIPEEIGPILDDVNQLVESLPPDDLRTVVDEAFTAFNGTGPDLARLIEGAQQLVGEADRSYPETEKLLRDLEPLLDTQIVTSDKIRSFVDDLALTTDQLRASDADLRRLLPATPTFAEEIVGLFQDLRPTLPLLLSNLTSVGQVLATYHASVEQVLVLIPTIPAILQTATAPYKDIHAGALDFKATVNDPPPCTVGYTPPEQWRSVHDIETIPKTPDGLFCKLPQSDPSVVRGLRNAPCPGSARRAPSPEECLSPAGYQPVGTNPWIDMPGGVPTPPAAAVTEVQYDPTTKRFQAPDGQFYELGDPSAATTWQQLVLPG